MSSSHETGGAPQLSRVTSIVSWKRVNVDAIRRWLAEYETQAIRALIARHDGRSNERILGAWKLRKTAGNWRSLILTSEAIYDATLAHRSCKRRCHLATVRAITASAVSGQFLIHIDGTYDALYVHRKYKQTVIDGIVRAAVKFRAVEVALVDDADLTLIPGRQKSLHPLRRAWSPCAHSAPALASPCGPIGRPRDASGASQPSCRRSGDSSPPG